MNIKRLSPATCDCYILPSSYLFITITVTAFYLLLLDNEYQSSTDIWIKHLPRPKERIEHHQRSN